MALDLRDSSMRQTGRDSVRFLSTEGCRSQRTLQEKLSQSNLLGMCDRFIWTATILLDTWSNNECCVLPTVSPICTGKYLPFVTGCRKVVKAFLRLSVCVCVCVCVCVACFPAENEAIIRTKLAQGYIIWLDFVVVHTARVTRNHFWPTSNKKRRIWFLTIR